MTENHRQGRLDSSLHPEAHAIIFPPLTLGEQQLHEFQHLTTLNKAHLVMLEATDIVSHAKVKLMLEALISLEDKAFEPLFSQKNERGTYFILENYLIKTLGMDVAGSLHLGRSRNDINATLIKLYLRESYQRIVQRLNAFRECLLNVAVRHFETVMPIYSQFQVAQIGTYANYLLAIDEMLSRDMKSLNAILDSLNNCPLGAGAGAGTGFPINTHLLAELLGFSSCSVNALDAIAERDIAVRMLSTSAILGTHLSRMAQDYQLWTTQEFNFFILPDNLCGGSSMMPQKKNPYLLEAIKGKSAAINGILTQALTAMHGVPIMNSMEVGTYALQGITNALEEVANVLTLSRLIVQGATPVQASFDQSIARGVAIATHLAEVSVKEKNRPFREIHSDIGDLVKQATSRGKDPEAVLLEEYGYINREKAIIQSLNNYGAGPGVASVKGQHSNAQQRLLNDIASIECVTEEWNMAKNKLNKSVKTLIG